MRERLLLLHARSQLKALDLGVLNTKLYSPPSMTAEEANISSWHIFKEKIKPLFIFRPFPDSEIEICITEKSTTWSGKDINTFAGSEKRVIRTLDDMSEEETQAFLSLNFILGQGLVNKDDCEVHVTIGFNPSDSSPGTHSIKDKLHSNIYVADNDKYRVERQIVKWQNLSWFERLSFIEPFSGIYHDYLSWLVRSGLFQGQLATPEIEENLGYTSIYFRHIEALSMSIPQIYYLYFNVRKAYEEAESVFTDREEELETGYHRFIPIESAEISHRLEQYVQSKKDWLSLDSVRILHYFASYIRSAKQRDLSVENIKSAGSLWTAKGFSGAINFTFNYENPQIRFDFLPRIVSTSSPTKVMSRKDHPTLIRKSMGYATNEEQSEIQNFQILVVKLASKCKGDVFDTHAIS